jgi:predicted O-linked N-acetylglucosamine transferase (SPINDLY family)
MKTMNPIIKFSNNEIEKIRLEIEKDIDEIINDHKKYNFNIDTHLIKPLQFSLSYDQFDNLELNKKCINFYKKIYPELNKTHNINHISSSKIKIGFISEYLTDHTIGKLFKGIILRLDKNKFEVIVFHTEKTKKGIILNQLKDAEKNGIIKNYFLPGNFNEKQKIILREKLDILFYPEIGLSLELYYLSFIKLAKYQITSWGHPETTGNPSIDYFLTSKLIEANESQKNFSEKLIHLDYLPMYYYTPLIKNEIEKSELSQNNIYSCPQTLQKLHPEFDFIIGEILDQDKKAVIYFIKDTNNILFKKIIDRFKKNKKIDLERVKFLDGLSWEEYINHCGKASVLLDPIYYGAGNSFYESVFYGTPTVTMPTQYTKSRLVLGAYNQMDISDLNFYPITKSMDEYIEKAINISNSKNLYEIKQNIQIKAKKNLYEKLEVIENFEKVFSDIVH